MDKINPFTAFNNSNSDIDRLKQDIKTKYNVPTENSSIPALPSVPERMDFRGIFDKQKEGEIKLFDQDINVMDTHKKIGNTFMAKYPSYIKGIDNNEYQAQQQSTGEKWSHGLQKLGLKTGTAVLGGTVGTVSGLFNAISEGSMTAMYTDDFNSMLDEYNEKLDYKLPNYYTSQERDMGFIDSMGTANFWANDVTGGLSFTLGMIVSEGIWAAATGGTSLIARGAMGLGKLGRWSTKTLGAEKALRGLNKYKEPAKKLFNSTAKADLNALRGATIAGSNRVKALNQARFIYTSAGYEAGVESRHYLKEMEDEWMMDFQEQNGRNPDQQEISKFLRETENSGNAVFGANLALVGSSNMAVFGKMLLGKSTKAAASNSTIKRELFGVGYTAKDGAYTAVKANARQKIAGKAYSILRAPVIEGVYEEGGQSVAAKSVKDYVLNSMDEDATQTNLSMMDSLIKGIGETYGTKAGQKEVGIGMIIGLFGGGMATGGRFNEMSQERKNTEKLVEYRNEFKPDRILATQITSERLKANNKIINANKRAEEARAKGDLTGEFLSEQQVILASVERDAALQGTKQGIADFEAYLETVDNAELAEEMDMDVSEVGEWKTNKLSEYKALSEKYQSTEKYVRALVGDQNFAGTAELKTSSEQIIKAITFNITLGDQSNEFTKKLVEDIKLVIGGEVNFDQTTMALEVDQVLASAPREAVTKYMELSKQTKALELERTNLEKQLISAQYNKGQSTPEAHAAKLQSIQEKIINVQEKIEGVNQTKEVAYRALGIQNDAITETDLDAQADRVKELQEKVEGYKGTNPELYTTLTKLFDEYNKAKANTMSFNKMTKELLDPKIRVDVLNGWMSSLLKKNKSLDESTKEFFKEQLERYETNSVQGKIASAKAQADRIQTETPDEVTEETADEMTPPAPDTQSTQSKTPLQMLKQKIADIMGKNVYTTTYIGNEYDEAIKNKPSEQDTSRYEELLGKINGKYITKFTQLLRAPKGWHKANKIDTGLTVAEIEELKGLQAKLSNWKVLEGSLDEGDSSVADLMLLVEQLETEVEKENTKTEITDNEYATLKQASEKEAREGHETSEGVQSPDQVVVSLIDIKGEATYSFSHLNVESLMKLFPNSTMEIVQGKVTKPISELSKSKLAELSKKEGTAFILNTPEGIVNIKIGKRSRLNISKKSLDNSIKSSNIAVIKYGSGNFMDVYERLSNGDLIPLKGDFSYESELKGEVIELVPDVVNNVTEGQVLITRINKNDRYNKALLDTYNKSKKTEEDFNTLMNDLHVYITDQTGKVVGSLRAAKEDLPDNSATKSLLELRRKAVEMILDENNKGDYFSLNEAIPVRTVLIGSPNFVIQEQEDGTLKPQGIDFTDTALEQVEDVGYLEGETLKLRNMDSDKVIKTFLPKKSSQKMPVVIIKVNGKNVAFPVTLKSITLDKTSEVKDILSTELRSTDKISRVSAILIESGLKPDNYITDNQGVLVLNEEKVLTDLANVKEFPNLVEWLQSSYKLENLKNEAQIGIDLDNNPFNLSKIMLDLSNTRTLGKAEQIRQKYNGIENREIQLRQDLQSAVKPILEGMNNYPNVDDVKWTNVLFAENELYKNPKTDVERRHNVNLLRDALFTEGKRISPPKAVRAAYGEEFIETLRKNIEELDRITNLKKKTRADIKNAEVSTQKDNEKAPCPK